MLKSLLFSSLPDLLAFHSNHPLNCSGGKGGTVPQRKNFDNNLPPLTTGIPKLQNDIFEV